MNLKEKIEKAPEKNHYRGLTARSGLTITEIVLKTYYDHLKETEPYATRTPSVIWHAIGSLPQDEV